MKKLTQPGLFLIFCLSVLISNANSMEDMPASIESDLQSDSLALVAFYNAMDGPNWTNNANWLTGPLNTWHGVTIDIFTNRVYALEQLDNGLNGTIPPEIGNLDSLRVLHLIGQGLHGTIPATIGDMVSLELLLIYNTQISGALPNEVTSLATNLNVIYLYENNISSLPDLTGDPILNMDVHGNNLTFESLEPNISIFPNSSRYAPQGLIGAPIDTTVTTGSIFINEIGVGGASSQYQWYRYGTPIAGATDSVLVLNNIALADSGSYHLEVTNSMVTGLTLTSHPIVVRVEEMMGGGSLQTDSLALVALYNATDGPNWNNNTNWLSGPLSTWHGVVIDTSFVTELQLSSNGLDGTLPQELGDLGGIRTLSLGGNSLADSFDVVLNLVTLEDLYLSNNDFTGAIPQEIGNLVNLRNLALGENPMTGTIPAAIGNLTLLEDLGLYNMGLQSPIPTEIGNLVNLKDLLLYGNNFSESFPLSITTLPNLEELYLSNNNFSDSIPPQIGNLMNLRTLSLANNNFTGSLPPEIGLISGLHFLILEDNQLSGTIPVEIGSLPQLESVVLRMNQFEGNPFDILTNPQLRLILIDDNNFNGIIPDSIGNLTNLESLWVHDNMFSGDIPDAVGSLPNLSSLLVSDNSFTYLPDLSGTPVDYILAARNRFTFESLEPNIGIAATFNYSPQDTVGQQVDTTLTEGTNFSYYIPVGGSANNYQWFKDGSPISGAIDSALVLNAVALADSGIYHLKVTNSIVTNLTLTSRPIIVHVEEMMGGGSLQTDSLALVALYNATDGPNWNNNTNWLLGPVDTWYGVTVDSGSVVKLALLNNNLSDSLPPEIGDLINLDTLLLGNNLLSGTIPSEIGSLGNLQQLQLSSNDFSGPIPPQIGDLSYLKYLNLSFNSLSGEIPPQLGNLSDLENLSLSGNDFFGEIPNELGALSNLKTLFLAINSLSGNPFDVLLSNTNLEIVFIQSNEFSGVIPDSISNLTNLERLRLFDNQFSGAIPTSFVDMPNLQEALLPVNEFSYIPQFPYWPDNLRIHVSRNKLTFESFEHNLAFLTIDKLQYVPQDSIGSPLDTALADGTYFEVSIPVGGTANVYQWYKDGSPIPGAIDSSLVINSFTALDTGTYYLEVTNTIVPALTLTSHLIHLGIVPDSCDGNFNIPDLQTSCASPTFIVPIVATDSVSSEAIGFDFCMEFDSAYMIPTGNATIGTVAHGGNPGIVDYYLNTNTPGQVTGLIFFNGAAPFPSYFSGSGTVIEVEFAYNGDIAPGNSFPVSLCSVSESTLYSGEISHCTGDPGTISVINDPTFVGTLKYWDKNGKLLVYDDLDPLNNIPTVITGADSTCTATGQSYLPDLNGQFTFEVSEGDYFTITRDIPGQFGDTTSCTNVMSWINGADQNRALRIATMDPTFIPNVYQVIAADVNQDGLINAADITLISARSVMNICGFTNDGINPAEDWLFIDQYTVENEPAFTISSTYPLDDGMGYHRGNVPSIPDCLPVPMVTSGACVATMAEDYIAILLGDVNGNWKTTDGGSLRIDESLADNAKGVSFDFASMRKEDQYYYLPVVIPSVDVEALDFYFEFKQHLTIEEVILISDDFEVNYNVFNEKIFLYSSYQLNSKTISGTILELKLSSAEPPVAEDFLSGMAFVDSEPISISTAPEPIVFSELKIYPNPVKGELYIEWPDDFTSQVSISLINMSGQTIYTDLRQVEPNTLLDISMAGIKHGIYFLEIKGDNTRKVFKVINQ